MDMNALFKVQCGLFVAAAEWEGKLGGCITNTVMQQSHVPVKFSVTLEKGHYTHDLVDAKGTMAISVLADNNPVDIIKQFGFVSGRDVDKFANAAHTLDGNGNPLLTGEKIAATYSLRIIEAVDVGTHTLFLCTADDAVNYPPQAITYAGYRESQKKKP